MVLIYIDELPDRVWKEDDFMPYVFYLNKNKKVVDFFFDGFLFLAMVGKDKKTLMEVAGKHKVPANKKEWLAFLNKLFKKNEQLDALNKTVNKGRKYFDKIKKIKVVIMLPYPNLDMKFEDIDGDKISEDFSKVNDRLKVLKWFMKEFLKSWKKKTF